MFRASWLLSISIVLLFPFVSIGSFDIVLFAAKPRRAPAEEWWYFARVTTDHDYQSSTNFFDFCRNVLLRT